MATTATSKSNADGNNNDLPLLSHLMDKTTLEALEQVDHLNYEKSKLIKKSHGQEVHKGEQWLPIDSLNDDKSIGFRTNYKPTDFRTNYKSTDFRSNYKSADFRSCDRATDSYTPKTSDKKYFPQNSPILSTEYIGNSTDVIRHSTSYIKISTDANNFLSTNSCTLSSEKFQSSDDILEYLRSHPDFQRMPPGILQAILAAILSGLLIIGGVALLVVSGGASTPGIFSWRISTNKYRSMWNAKCCFRNDT